MVDQADRGRPGVAGTVITGALDAVGIVAGPLGRPGVSPVAALGVEVLRAGDAGHDGCQDALAVVKGKGAAANPSQPA